MAWYSCLPHAAPEQLWLPLYSHTRRWPSSKPAATLQWWLGVRVRVRVRVMVRVRVGVRVRVKVGVRVRVRVRVRPGCRPT